MNTTDRAISWTEQGLVPDVVIGAGIRRLLKQRLAEIHADDTEAASQATLQFVRAMDAAPIAPIPEKANEQHYEVPAAFFAEALGTYRKYSSCYWAEGTTTLDGAEAAALAMSCELADGQDTVRALGYPESFVRMWEFYLCYCEGGFLERVIGDVQMLLVKPQSRRAPLGRAS